MPEPKPGSYGHFARVAGALGVPYHGAAELHLDLEGARVVASLDLNSGTVVAVTFQVHSGPYPDVTVRKETDSDKKGKGAGINREVTLGDAAFDDKVYIDSGASDDALQAMFDESDVRSAILLLVERSYSVVFGARGVVVQANAERDAESPFYDAEPLRHLLETIATLARVPRIASAAPTRSASAMISVAMGLLSAVGIVFLAISLHAWEPREAWLTLGGIGAGLLIFLAEAPLFRRLLRGRSSSYRRYRAALAVSFVSWGIFCAGLAVFVNGAAGEEGREISGKVEEVENESEGERIHVLWEDGSDSSVLIDDPKHEVVVGDSARLTTGRGALGARWNGMAIVSSRTPPRAEGAPSEE